MQLWIEWWSLVVQLRPAFTRLRTFLWFATALCAISVRGDLLGVTSLVRSLGLQEHCYDRLLDLFHSRAFKLERLTILWVRLAMTVLGQVLYLVNGRIVLVADGIKVPKTGRKMPAVKKLHQESDNNTKPQYIFGHSCQAISLVVHAAAGFLAVPLACRIHEGVVFSNRDKRTLLDKLVELVFSLAIDRPLYLIADAYYASGKIILPLLKKGQHLVTAVRSNAVAYEPVKQDVAHGRGRPRIYGKKIKIKDCFKEETAFSAAASPVYGESGVMLQYRVLDLLWRPVGQRARFVLVIHPTRGRIILMSTDLSLAAVKIIEMYGVRFKIEIAFKQAVHTLGAYAYHFWMSTMTPRLRRSGNQYIHRKSEAYRNQVRRKIAAYHAYIQTGIIAQGLLQMLALRCTASVWKHFGSWLRTVRPGVLPSEFVVAIAMRHSLPLFLADCLNDHILVKFIRQRIDISRIEGIRLAA
jgi:hypothetical protein